MPSPQVPLIAALLALAAIPINVVMWWLMFTGKSSEAGMYVALFCLIALGQLICGLVALISGIRYRVKVGTGGVGSAVVGGLTTVGALTGWLAGMASLALGAGGAWGRPLRVRGRQLHPELKAGSDWTRGDRPSPAGLDEPTRAALEGLWLHDAQKEHASVPAFARVSWMLAAAGAPAELLEWSHRAALEEIEHTRLCFALAAGYAGRSHSVEAMPDLLVGGLDVKGNALEVLAIESLGDGCQLEDFNADVAAACAAACEEPVTKQVLETIAREERTHAGFSWAVVEWLLSRDAGVVGAALRKTLATLDAYPRPTAVGRDKLALVAKASPQALLKHGRLPDERWAELWSMRLQKTRDRLWVALQAHGADATPVYGGLTQVGSPTQTRA